MCHCSSGDSSSALRSPKRSLWRPSEEQIWPHFSNIERVDFLHRCRLVGPFRTDHPDFPTFPDTERYSDEELAEWVRNHAEVLYHPVGTVAMGLDASKGGCLDEDLKVHGVANLRVCDASIFPEQLSGHPVR